MKKIAVFFVLGIIFFGCKENSKEIIPEKSLSNFDFEYIEESKEIVYGEPFFDFEEVIYYSNPNINHTQVIRNSQKGSSDDKLLLEIILEEYPEKISDTENLERLLLKSEYLKSIVDTSKNKPLTMIFSESDCSDEYATACAPTFRDILIFKKQGKTVGIAKICFGCNKHYIIGTNKKTINFGECGGFGKLKHLLS